MQRDSTFLWRTVIPFFILAIPFTLFAQEDLSLGKVEGEGLTNYYIKCITQDKDGFLWFGTEEGLFRYDGYSFHPVRNFPPGPGSLPNSNIECLYPGDSGQIWAGSRGGLSCIDGRTMTVRNFISNTPFTVYALLPQGDTAFIAGTSSGLFVFSRPTATWRRIQGFDTNLKIRSVTAGKGGDIYLVSHQGLFVYNLHTQKILHYDLPAPPGLPNTLQIGHRSMLDKDGSLWVSTWNAGLLKFEPATGKISTFLPHTFTTTPGLPHVALYDLLAEPDGKIRLASAENGVTLLDPTAHTASNYLIRWDNNPPIKARVYALYRDRSGILWVGTENGIYKSDPHEPTLSTLNFRQNPTGPAMRYDLEPLHVLKDRQAHWWLATYEGIYLLDPATGMLTDYSAQAGLPPHTRVTGLIEEEDGIIWASTGYRLLRLRRSGDPAHPHLDATVCQTLLINSAITCIYQDHKKKIWCGTHGDGVFRFDPETRQFTALAGPDNTIYLNTEIRCIAETSNGTLWVGGEHTGLLAMRPQEDRLHSVGAFAHQAGNAITVNGISPDTKDRVWIGTEGHGLWQKETGADTFRPFTIHDGLPSMNIIHTLATPEDHLWMITEEGAVDFRYLQKKMVVFNRQAGIRNPYSVFALSRTDDGQVVIGDMGCLHTYSGKETIGNTDPPKVFITGFRVLDKDYPADGTTRPVLNYEQNYFSFEYVALNFTRPALNRYAYMLEGLDTRWNDAGTRRYASYANLKEGAYTFRVKACNSEGVWNDTPVSISFIIQPPFWRKGWFYLLVTALIISLIVILYLYKTGQARKSEELRNRIARDLHDDIGSTLSGINIFSRIALQKITTRPGESEELLQRIHRRSEKTMEALSDIVWSINTRGDHITSLVSRMQEYLGESLESLDIQYQFEVDQSVRQLHIDMEIRRDIYLIFKEAVNNASKYSGCTRIDVRMKKESPRTVSLEVEDNGTGFDTHSIVPGNGINNMQERATRIRAVCTVHSAPGAGTRIHLLFPVT